MEKYAVYATRAGRLSYLRIYFDYEEGLRQVAALLAGCWVEEAGITGEPEEISSLARRKWQGR